jgi:hypothetical protein
LCRLRLRLYEVSDLSLAGGLAPKAGAGTISAFPRSAAVADHFNVGPVSADFVEKVVAWPNKRVSIGPIACSRSSDAASGMLAAPGGEFTARMFQAVTR